MDPVTAALNVIAGILALLTKVWDKMPENLQVQGASDMANSLHKIAEFVLGMQTQINALQTKITAKQQP